MNYCKHCGGEINKSPQARYCSLSCRSKAGYLRNPAAQKLRRAKERGDIVSFIYSRIKSRCKKNNIPFNLEREDIVIPEICPVLGIKLEFNFGKGSGFHPDSPSVDRIDPGKGYTKGNVRVISARANLLKNDATIEELELVLKDLERLSNAN